MLLADEHTADSDDNQAYSNVGEELEIAPPLTLPPVEQKPLTEAELKGWAIC